MRVFGVDEVGRGPLAGPVVAAAVCWLGEVPGVADSKTLKPAQRLRLSQSISESCPLALGAGSVTDIDRLNILQASLLAMARAVHALARSVGPPDLVLVDGQHLPPLPFPARAIVGGDAAEPAIAAASIVAKVTRDRLMQELGRRDPRFGFESHMGYGTRQHLEALARHGPGPHHRLSFAPIRNWLGN